MPKGARKFTKKYASIGLAAVIASSNIIPSQAQTILDLNESIEVTEQTEGEDNTSELHDDSTNTDANNEIDNEVSSEEESNDDSKEEIKEDEVKNEEENAVDKDSSIQENINGEEDLENVENNTLIEPNNEKSQEKTNSQMDTKNEEIRTTGLQIHDVNITNRELMVGSKSEITIKASSDIKVREFDVRYDCQDGSTLTVYLNYDSDRDLYVGTLEDIDKEITSYSLDRILVFYYDNSTESITPQKLEEKYNINATELNYKIIPFAIKDLFMDNNEIYANEEDRAIKVEVELANNSQYDKIRIAYENEVNSTTYYIFLHYNVNTNKYEGKIEANNLGNIESIFKVKNITAIRGYYECAVASREEVENVEKLDFNSRYYKCKDIILDKNNLTLLDKTKISLDLSNLEKEIKSVEVKYKEGNIIELTYNNSTNLFEGYYEQGLEYIEKDSIERICITTEEGYDIDVSSYVLDMQEGDITITQTIQEFVNEVNLVPNKKQFNPGETILYEFKGTTTPFLGAVEFVDSNGNSYIEDIYYNKDTNKSEIEFPVGKYMNSGDLVVKSIMMNDENDYSVGIINEALMPNNKVINSVHIKDFSSSKVEIINDLDDREVPKLEGVSIDNGKVTEGDVVTVSLDIKDNISGVKDAYLVYENKHTNSYEDTETVKAYYNPITKKYEAKIEVSSAKIQDSYKLIQVQIFDRAGNVHYINDITIANAREAALSSQDLSNGNYEVFNTIEQPHELIDEIIIDEKLIAWSESSDISLTLNNDIGVDSVELKFINPSNMYQESIVELAYNEETRKFEGEFIPYSDHTSSDWKLSNVAFLDNNQIISGQNVYTLSEYSDCYVTYNYEFTHNLNIDELSLDKANVTANEKITIRVKASSAIEGDSVEKGRIVYKEEESGEYMVVELKRVNDELIGEIDIDEFTKSGEWKVVQFNLFDNHKNMAYISDGNMLRDIYFTVYDTLKDDKAPEIIDFNFSEKYVQNGDNVVLSVNATDVDSGIKSVEAVLAVQSGIHLDLLKPVELEYNPKNNKYEYTITPENFKYYDLGATIRLMSLNVEDNAGNYTSKELEKVWFEKCYIVKKNVSLKEITDQSTLVKGTAEKDSTIILKIGQNEYETYADKKGNFSLEIKKPKANENVTLEVYNTATVLIDALETKVIDVTPPDVPIIENITTNSTVIKGKAEPNATVVISINEKEVGKVKADDKGVYSLNIDKQEVDTIISAYAIDAANLESEITETIVALGYTSMNQVPTLHAEDIFIEQGESFDPLKYIKATDNEDGDITNKVEVIENTVNVNELGKYKVTYKVSDSGNASTTKTINVEVVKKDIDNPDIEKPDIEDPDTDKPSGGGNEIKPPQTGDKSMFAYLGMASTSLLGVVFTNKRKKEMNK